MGQFKPGPEPAKGYSTPGVFTVVLWGPTNVGKSTLFNKLTSTRKAIVANRPGVTVDTHALTFEKDDSGEFRVIDSGGVGYGLATHELKDEIELRAMRAVADANLILFVVDGSKEQAELVDLAKVIRKEAGLSKVKVPIALVVNKCDRSDFSQDSLYALGFSDMFPISAEHSKGLSEVWEYIKEEKIKWLKTVKEEDLVPVTEAPVFPRVLILGRPNVGKSTLMNYLSGKNTSAVSSVAGTTRDFVSERAFVDNSFEVLLTDTAGLRRPGRRERDVEWVATNKIIDLSRRADLAVLVVDASEGVTDQDSAIAGFAIDAGLSLVVAFNKWDIVKDDKDMEYKFQEIERSRDLKMAFLSWCPVIRISAKTGLGIKTLKEKILEVTKARFERVQTSDLNSVFEKRIRDSSGVTSNGGGGREKLYFMSQVASNPPEFVVFCNLPADRIHFSFRRYISNILREEFGFAGTPIKLHFKQK
jgi:GTP-binding protein